VRLKDIYLELAKYTYTSQACAKDQDTKSQFPASRLEAWLQLVQAAAVRLGVLLSRCTGHGTLECCGAYLV
jgi:hypothetical protein